MSSNATVTTLAGVARRLARRGVRFASSATTNSLVLVRAAAFWTAVLLPFVFLGLLAGGSTVIANPSMVVLFVAVDVGALLAGHGHGAPPRYEDRARTPTRRDQNESLDD